MPREVMSIILWVILILFGPVVALVMAWWTPAESRRAWSFRLLRSAGRSRP
jgi:hypothetical protein